MDYRLLDQVNRVKHLAVCMARSGTASSLAHGPPVKRAFARTLAVQCICRRDALDRRPAHHRRTAAAEQLHGDAASTLQRTSQPARVPGPAAALLGTPPKLCGPIERVVGVVSPQLTADVVDHAPAACSSCHCRRRPAEHASTQAGEQDEDQRDSWRHGRPHPAAAAAAPVARFLLTCQQRRLWLAHPQRAGQPPPWWSSKSASAAPPRVSAVVTRLDMRLLLSARARSSHVLC
jgi:hypothetical protein